MNKQKLVAVSFKQLLLTFIMSSLLTLSVDAKQQTVLLDANGKPLSNEVLLLLSNASYKLPSNKRSSKSTKNKNENKNKNKKNGNKKDLSKGIVYVNNPILEQELLSAMKAGKTARVKQLIRAKIRPTYRNYKGETPLGVAVSRGWASIVNDLLAHGADINEEGRQGLTLLHVAAAKGLIDVAKILVKKGIDPATETKTGWTPLHVASRYGHWQLVQYFLKLGVDPNAKNKSGRTALDLAINLKHQGIIKILSRVTSEKPLHQIRIENLREVRLENHKKRLAKLEKLKEFRRIQKMSKKK